MHSHQSARWNGNGYSLFAKSLLNLKNSSVSYILVVLSDITTRLKRLKSWLNKSLINLNISELCNPCNPYHNLMKPPLLDQSLLAVCLHQTLVTETGQRRV